MKRTHTIHPLPDCECRKIILASRILFPEADVDERTLYAWGCPLHDKKMRDAMYYHGKAEA